MEKEQPNALKPSEKEQPNASEKSRQLVNFDNILIKYLGEIGRYQIFIIFTVWLVGFSASGHQLGHVFLAAIPNYWCHIDNCTWDAQQEVCGESNLTRWGCEEAIVDYTSPADDSDTNSIDEHQCRQYVNVTCDQWSPDGSSYNRSFGTTGCKDGWDYDQSTYEASIVTDFDLVCGKAYLESLASSLFLTGLLVGVPINGALADKFGRKTMLIITGMTSSIFGICTAFSVNYSMFVICRFIIGTAVNSSHILAFVIISEFVGPSKRAAATTAMPMAFSLGYALLTIIAYFLRDWRALELAVSIPYIFLFSLYFWIIPESPRWLISKPDKIEKGRKIIEKMAKVNKVALPDNVLDPRLYEDMVDDEDDDREDPKTTMDEKDPNGNISEKENKFSDTNLSKKLEELEKNPNVLDLLRLPNMRRKTINIYFNWFVNGLVYYGLSLNTSNLGGSDYVNSFISAAVEIPGTLLAWWAMDVPQIGRVKTLAYSLILAGAFCLITPFPPQTWLSITFAMIGKMGSKMAFNTVYVVSAEIYPTSVRSVGMGSSSMWARLGSILAPQLIFIGQTWPPLPYFIYGLSSVIGGILTLLLPETLGKKLPKTLEEGEAFGKKTHNKTKKIYYKNVSIQTNNELGLKNDGFEL